jgi:hypothetical protein
VEFEWDERNLRHIFEDSPHGLTPQIVQTVAASGPLLVPNQPGVGRSGSHIMIGMATEAGASPGRFWTVILLDLGRDLWRPITGWPSTDSEIRLLNEREDRQ